MSVLRQLSQEEAVKRTDLTAEIAADLMAYLRDHPKLQDAEQADLMDIGLAIEVQVMALASATFCMDTLAEMKTISAYVMTSLHQQLQVLMAQKALFEAAPVGTA